MPIGAIITALGSLAGGAVNALQQNRQNRRSQQFALDMYNRQKADNLEFWNMQNDYNSPQAQMKRFQEANLNPNLIYGQGSGGNAGSIQTPDLKMPEFRSSNLGDSISSAATNGLNAYFDIQYRKAQLDNARAQNTVLQEEATLKRAETDRVLTDTEARRFDLDFKNEFRTYNADALRERVRQTRISTDLAISRDARNAATTSSNLKEAVSRMETQFLQRQQMRQNMAKTKIEMANIRAQTTRVLQGVQLLKQQGTLNELEIQLRNKNLTFRDPLWTRMVAKALDKMFPDFNLLGN